MSVKIIFEVGHVASLKSKITQEGFTHDWELFVRGCDSADISPYIEKVVFTLHESFPKPKRVVKEPPYSIKESGYAGFVLPIDIYFKCRDETKKLTYSYDLSLQTTTGTFTNTVKKWHTFQKPSDDFRRKLLRGGGILVGSSTAPDEKLQHNPHAAGPPSLEDARMSQLINKPKMSGSEGSKKYKTKSEESSAKVSNQYANLFGSSGGGGGSKSSSSATKVSPDPKKASPSISGHGASSSNSSVQPPPPSSSSLQKSDRSSRGEKSDRDKKEKNKHSSPAKDKLDEKKKYDERREEKRKDKTHSKDRDRNRDKSSKHAASPKPVSGLSTALTRSPKLSQSPVIGGGKVDDTVKQSSSKHSALEPPPQSDRPSSSAKKSKKDKKEKSHDSRDRERRSEKEHKSKEERSSSKTSDRNAEVKSKEGSSSSSRPPSAVPVVEVTPTKEKARVVEQPPKPIEHVHSDPPAVAAPKPVAVPSGTPSSDSKSAEKTGGDSERKHKHKKKDKSKEKEHGKDKRKERSSRHKEDAGSSKKQPVPVAATPIASSSTPTNIPPPSQPKSNPLNKLLSEIGDKVSSDSEDDHNPPTASDKSSTVSENPNSIDANMARTTPFEEASTAQVSSTEKTSDKSHKRARKDPKSSAEKDEKKRKRKSKDDTTDLKRKTPSPAVPSEPPAKQSKRDQDHNHNPSQQPVASTATRNHLPSPDLSNHTSDQRSSSPHFPTANHHSSTPPTQNHPPSAPTPPNRPRSSPPESAQQPAAAQSQHDYMSVLKSLQHKIMTLEDHAEVQQVVELIAETGCYEMTTHTFDFDLCVLDRKIVQRLLDFFATSCA